MKARNVLIKKKEGKIKFWLSKTCITVFKYLLRNVICHFYKLEIKITFGKSFVITIYFSVCCSNL